jgi:hypothetical protein
MSDEEPHDGQESATIHWLLARARAERASAIDDMRGGKDMRYEGEKSGK